MRLPNLGFLGIRITAQLKAVLPFITLVQRNFKMYQLLPINRMTGESAQSVKRLSDSAFIPFDSANTDYQDYLKWLAEGNIPLPADS